MPRLNLLARLSWMATTAVLLGSATAAAQTSASIAGVVKDATGAVLPGVTVEAASPVLIERARSVVSDERGEYKIIDLRPGTYSISASLQGFGTYKREGIELAAGFTANINPEMRVGAVEETLTVTGATPVVDLSNSRTQQVLEAKTLDALPVGTKSLMQIASLTLGAVSSIPGRNDVGGDKGENYTGVAIHGGRGGDGRINWDGMYTGAFYGSGGGLNRVYYLNTVGVQEVVVDTGGNSAEIETGGANINMVPKEGGNRFSFLGSGTMSTAGQSASSIPSDIAARGALPQSSMKEIYDWGAGIGGPIVRDKLWFFTANRWWGAQNDASNNFFNKSTNPLFYVPDLNRPAYADTFFRDNAVRLTWQANSKLKISQEEHLQNGCLCWQQIGNGALASPEAVADSYYGPAPQVLSETNFTYVASSRLLIQGNLLFLAQHNAFEANTALNKNGFLGTGNSQVPAVSSIAITELTGVPGGAPGGYTYGALPPSSVSHYTPLGNLDNDDNFSQRVAVSYVTGTHAFKAGIQLLEGAYDFSTSQGLSEVAYTFSRGVPVGLAEWAGPFVELQHLSSQAVYAQDQWTLNRLTINAGLRFDRFHGHTLSTDVPTGQFVAARTVPAADNLPDFKDITPRLGAAFDLFGDGKTAIKGSFGRYLYGQGGSLGLTVSPALAIVQSVTRTWTNNIGDYIPHCNLQNPAANGECGAISNTAFGQPITNTSIADDARQGWFNREYNYETTIQLQQQLRPGVGLALGYYHTSWGNQTATVNTAVSPSDYTQYCVTAPSNAGLAQFSGNQVCGLYNINPNKFGQVNNVITLAKNYGNPQEAFDSVDLLVTARWAKGGSIQGGTAFGREIVDYCYANSLPNVTPENFPAALYPRNSTYCRVVSPWLDGIGTQAKIAIVYPLPWDLIASGTYKNLPGIPDTANLVQTNAQVAPALGRNLAGCPAVGPCSATVTVPLIAYGSNGDTPQGTVFDLRLNETDVRLAKIFHLGANRSVQANFELYNVFNARTPQAINPTYGAAWETPSLLLGGRLFKVSGTLTF